MGKPVPLDDNRPSRPALFDFRALASLEGCRLAMNHLLELSPSELGRFDIGTLNLLCAPALPGSEQLDVARCIVVLNRLTEFVRARTERNRHHYQLTRTMATPNRSGGCPCWSHWSSEISAQLTVRWHSMIFWRERSRRSRIRERSFSAVCFRTTAIGAGALAHPFRCSSPQLQGAWGIQ